MAESSLTLQETPQLSSSLVQLPDEILTKILRYLMKSDDALRSLTANYPVIADGTKLRDAKLCLSSQIMRTCQKFLRYGHEILYSDNTLQMSCAPISDLFETFFCRVLDRVFELPSWDERIINYECELTPDVKAIGWSEGLSTDVEYARALISKFSKVEFSLYRHRPVSVHAMMFRWFHSLNVQEQMSVTLSYQPPKRQGNEAVYIEIVTTWFRCKQIVIIGMAEDQFQQAINIVQSGSKVKDVTTQMMKIKDITAQWYDNHTFSQWIYGCGFFSYGRIRRLQEANIMTEFLRLLKHYIAHIADTVSPTNIKELISGVIDEAGSCIKEAKATFEPGKRRKRSLNAAVLKGKKTIAAIHKMEDGYTQLIEELARLETEFCKPQDLPS